MTPLPAFIHLRIHTEYSLLEGAVPVKKLPGLCARAGMPAVAMTDTNNMFARAGILRRMRRAPGIQPIIGCQIALGYDPAEPGERPRAARAAWCCWRSPRPAT